MAPWSARTHDVGVEHGQERVEVAVARGGQEGVDDLALALDVGVGHRLLALDAPAGAAGQLAGRLGRALDDRRDLVEGDGEDVVQDEGQPLGRARVSSTTSRATPTESARSASCSGSVASGRSRIEVGHVRPHRLLAPGAPRAQDVQRDPGDDGRQPGPEVLDVAGVGPAEADPGLLDGVVRLAERARACGRPRRAGATAVPRSSALSSVSASRRVRPWVIRSSRVTMS